MCTRHFDRKHLFQIPEQTTQLENLMQPLCHDASTSSSLTWTAMATPLVARSMIWFREARRVGKNHNGRCHNRLMKESAKTDEGKKRSAEMGLRQYHYAATEIQKTDRHQGQGVQWEQRVRIEPLHMEPPLFFPFLDVINPSQPNNHDASTTTTSDYPTKHAATTKGDNG